MKEANGIGIAAAGNENENSCIPDENDRNTYPCASDDIICVGNYQWDGDTNRVERFFASDVDASNFGECVDIWGPGTDITMAFPSRTIINTYYDDTGTSFASPIVTGIAAVWLASSIRDGDPLEIVGNTDNLLATLKDDGYMFETCDFQSECYGVKYPDCPTMEPTILPSNAPTTSPSDPPTVMPTVAPTEEERDLIDDLIDSGITGWALLIIIIILAACGISVYRSRNKNKQKQANETETKVKLEMTHA